MNRNRALLALAFVFTTLIAAQQPSSSVKPIGATFLEAPPGRDKNLAPFGSFGSLEKVE